MICIVDPADQRFITFLERLKALDEQLASILIGRFNEAVCCSQANAYLSAVVQLGSVVEGVFAILLKLEREWESGKSKGNDSRIGEKLEESILGAEKREWLTADLIGQLRRLQTYRNCVHPLRQSEEGLEFNENRYIKAKAIVEEFFDELEPMIELQCRQRDFLLTLPEELIGRETEQKNFKYELFKSPKEGKHSGGSKRYRLITVCGPPGIGKTVFVEKTIRGLKDSPLDQEYILSIDLAETSSALAFESKEAFLLKQLRSRRKSEAILLILHSCEHLTTELREPILTALKNRPNLRIIATSIKPLGFPTDFELRFPLTGLSFECDPGNDENSSEVVRLFIQQIRKLRHWYQPSSEEIEYFQSYGRQLGGNPLAICLLAPEFSRRPHTLPTKLTEKGNGVDQFGLEAIFKRAFDLLDLVQQKLLIVLLIYVRQTDVEDIYSFLEEHSHNEISDCIDNLSLTAWIHLERGKISILNGTRHFLYSAASSEHIRKYRIIQLHLLLQRLLDSIKTKPHGIPNVADFTDEEQSNVLNCLEYFKDSGEMPDEGFELISALGHYWTRLGFADLGMNICLEACHPLSSMRTERQLSALKALGMISRQASRTDIAIEAHECLARATQDSPVAHADALQQLSDDFYAQNDMSSAMLTSKKALDVCVREPDSEDTFRLRARSYEQLANIHRHQNELEFAKSYLQKARVTHNSRNYPNEWVRAWLDLLEANLLHDEWQNRPDNPFTSWIWLSKSATTLFAHQDYMALAHVAERGLQYALTLDDRLLVREFYGLAKSLRSFTNSTPHSVDIEEYLQACFSLAESKYEASADQASLHPGESLQNKLVALLIRLAGETKPL